MCHFSELKLSEAACESPSSHSLCHGDQHCSGQGLHCQPGEQSEDTADPD